MRTSAAVGLVTLAAALVGFPPGSGSGGEPPEPGPLAKRMLKFRVQGTFDSFNPLTHTVTFRFSGPFYATRVDADSGTIGDEPGPQVGRLENARARFTFDPTKGLTSDGARFSCDDCRMVFDDGSVLEPILDDPGTPLPEPDIPMEGRLLLELGPVPGSAPGTQTFRGVGCGGAKETAGAGAFANAVGAVCVNGTFTFPAPFPSDPRDWIDTAATGESDCTFVFHVPGPER